MTRRIIKIDGDKCDGCGLCADACKEGAIGIVNGKAKLLRDDYCDGLGDCLPVCPTGAISFETREAVDYDEEAVKNKSILQPETLACGCPGSHSASLRGGEKNESPRDAGVCKTQTHLSQWPVQIKLVPANAPYLDGAHLLIAADCAAYAHGNFHEEFMKGKITLIGCPKLDEGDYAEKLTSILKSNEIKSVTVARIEVPCCGGIERAVREALTNCGKLIPWQVVTISTNGEVSLNC